VLGSPPHGREHQQRAEGDERTGGGEHQNHAAPTNLVGEPAADDPAGEDPGRDPGGHDAQDRGAPPRRREPARDRAETRAHRRTGAAHADHRTQRQHTVHSGTQRQNGCQDTELSREHAPGEEPVHQGHEEGEADHVPGRPARERDPDRGDRGAQGVRHVRYRGLQQVDRGRPQRRRE
jgi:hypothetical protein